MFVSQQGKRYRAGEISRVEFEQSQLPLKALEADSLQAAAAVQVAYAQVLSEFPNFNWVQSGHRVEQSSELDNLPDLSAQEQDAWKARLVEQNHALELQRKQTELRHALFNRAQADRIADPTVAMHLTRERDNAERIVGLSLSVPLGGELRESRAAIAQSQYAQSSVQEAQAQRAAYSEAQQLLINYQSQREAQLRLNSNAQKARSLLSSLKKAFDLGEISQTELNLARQQAIQTQLEYIKAQTLLEKLVGQLLIDAHLSWVGP
jgi:outer membrane protein TolC